MQALLLIPFAWLLAGFATSSAAADRVAVVLVFDGVTERSLDVAPVPTFERVRREGSFTHRFEPPFPSNSLPGGFTLSTGCHPEHHGVVNNLFEDPERGLYDHSSDADWTTGCEGLHEAAERQGVRTAALGWYGSHSGERGALASIVGEAFYEDRPTDEERAARVAQLLGADPNQRPGLILAYFEGPDTQEHYTGFDSDETRAAVLGMDANLATVLAAAESARRRGSEVAVFTTTDHGMIPIRTIVNIQRLIHWHDIPARPISTGASSYLYFEDPSDRPAIEAARDALAAYEEIDAWLPSEAPAWAHIGTSERVGQLVVTTLPPYFIEDVRGWPTGLRWLGRIGPRFINASLFAEATHGYPPGQVPEIHGVLYAWGDGIAVGGLRDGARAIDLHPTVLTWLGLEPGTPVDGRALEALLAPDN